jgi:hypothetical protein
MFVLATLKEQLATLNFFFRLFTLCSARVGAFVTIVTVRVKETENGRLVRF